MIGGAQTAIRSTRGHDLSWAIWNRVRFTTTFFYPDHWISSTRGYFVILWLLRGSVTDSYCPASVAAVSLPRREESLSRRRQRWFLGTTGGGLSTCCLGQVRRFLSLALQSTIFQQPKVSLPLHSALPTRDQSFDCPVARRSPPLP